jgi:hypothetical protein
MTPSVDTLSGKDVELVARGEIGKEVDLFR